MAETVTKPSNPIISNLIIEGMNFMIIPSITELCNRNGIPYPTIQKVSAEEIVITGLPRISATDANNSAIAAICHQFQHLYRDGDYVGKSGIKEKHAAKEPLCNSDVRIAFTYTMSYRNSLLKIKLMRNHADQPINLHAADPEVILRAHVRPKYIRKYGDNAYLAVPMTKAEIKYYSNLFSAQCAQAIQYHLNQVFVSAVFEAHETGKPVKPDYYSIKTCKVDEIIAASELN